MALKDLTPRMRFLAVIGWLVTALTIMSFTSLLKFDYSNFLIFLILAGFLAAGFFRRRKIALAIIGLTCIFVYAGLTAIFHPTVRGIFVTSASSGGLYILAVWQAKKYPHLTSRNWQILFDRDPD